MNHIQKMKEERTELFAKQKTILERVKADGHETVPAADMRILDAIDSRRKEIDAELAAVKADEELIQRLSNSWRASGGDTGADWRDFDFDQIKDGLARSISSKGSYGFNMPFTKAAITAGALDIGPSGEDISVAPPGDSAVALRDLFTVKPVDVPIVRYYKVALGSGADIVAEGGEKPELTTGITPVDAELSKIAVRFTYTDELAQDANFLISHIGREAMRSVMRRENTLILATLDAETNALTATGAEGDVIDVLAEAIGAAEATNGLTPARILANPADVAAIRTLKASGSGQYAIDPLTSAPTAVHGVQLVPVPAVEAGTLYLTTPGLGVFYAHRSGLRVESGFAAGDWEHNRASARVEERVLPTIHQPSLLTRVTLTEEP